MMIHRAAVSEIWVLELAEAMMETCEERRHQERTCEERRYEERRFSMGWWCRLHHQWLRAHCWCRRSESASLPESDGINTSQFTDEVHHLYTGHVTLNQLNIHLRAHQLGTSLHHPRWMQESEPIVQHSQTLLCVTCPRGAPCRVSSAACRVSRRCDGSRPVEGVLGVSQHLAKAHGTLAQLWVSKRMLIYREFFFFKEGN